MAEDQRQLEISSSKSVLGWKWQTSNVLLWISQNLQSFLKTTARINRLMKNPRQFMEDLVSSGTTSTKQLIKLKCLVGGRLSHRLLPTARDFPPLGVETFRDDDISGTRPRSMSGVGGTRGQITGILPRPAVSRTSDGIGVPPTPEEDV